MDNLQIKDTNTFIEHSMVINNFVTTVGIQLKSSVCRVFGDSVKYKWSENDNKPVIPDVSINCDIKNRRSTKFFRRTAFYNGSIIRSNGRLRPRGKDGTL